MSNEKHYPTHPGAELTPIELENNLGQDVNGEVHRVPWKAYDIDEVDALVAEKNKEITELRDESAELHNRIATLLSQIRIRDERIDELKAKLESVQATAYAESVDAGMRERRLRRALYKACANWADCKACILEYVGVKLHAKKWEGMFNKCRAKAKEYK